MPSTNVAHPYGSVGAAIGMNIAMLAMLAAAPLFAPDSLLSGFGVHGASFAVFGIVRVIAVFALVLAVLLWEARKWLRSADGRGAVFALAGAYAAAALLLFVQQWSVWDGRSGLALTLGCGALALAYAGALLGSRRVALEH